MNTEQNTIGMESVIELIWNTEDVSVRGLKHDHREDGGSSPPESAPCRCTPPPGRIARLFMSGWSCFG